MGPQKWQTDLLDSMLPTRKPTTGQFGEAAYAEVATLALFWTYFRKKYGDGSVVFTQLEYKKLKMTGSPAASFILDVMAEEFRNMLSPGKLKKDPNPRRRVDHGNRT